MHKRVIGVFLLLFILAVSLPLSSSYAASLDVSAQVNAPLPPNGETPIVETPGDNSTQTVQNIFITGQCIVIDPTLIVVLLRDNQTIGSGPCLPDGTFRILVGLVKGLNIIYPKFMTITGQSSGVGQPIRLQLNVPEQPVNVPKNTANNPADSQGKPQTEGLKLVFEYDFVSYDDATPTQVSYQILGGYKPYVVTINWGDGTQTTAKITSNDPQTAKHQYASVLPPAAITLTAVDASSEKVVQSRTLISFKKGVYIPASAPVGDTKGTGIHLTTVQKIWVGAGTVSVGLLLANHLGLLHSSNQTRIKQKAKKTGKKGTKK